MFSDAFVCFVLLLEGLCVVTAAFLIYHRFRPIDEWTSQLGIAWWLTLVAGALALVWVLYLIVIASAADDRLVAYFSAWAFSPAIASAAVAVFFKP